MPSCQIKFRIGQAFRIPTQTSTPARAQLRELTDMMMERIAQLIPEEYQGYYKFKQNK